MTPHEEAKRIFDACHELIDRYKTVEVVFHHRILAKRFAVMIVDEILKYEFLNIEVMGNSFSYTNYKEVKRILVEEYIWKPDKPEL